jgi:hypothetical protein
MGRSTSSAYPILTGGAEALPTAAQALPAVGSATACSASVIVAGYPAPPDVAAQIYNEGLIPNLVARVTQAGESPDDAIGFSTSSILYQKGSLF